MAETARRFNIPVRFFLLTCVLLSVGLVTVYSSSASYAAYKRRVAVVRNSERGADALADDHAYHEPRFLAKQAVWVALGLVLMTVAYHFDYRRLKDLGLWFLVGSFALLLLVFVPGIGVVVNGHHRWIGIGPFTFQPSELAKLALVIYMARMLDNHHDKIKLFLHGVMPALFVTGVFALTIIVEPDIGAAFVLTSIVFVMWFIGGMRILHLGGLVTAVVPAFVYVVLMFPDRVARVAAFINPTSENLKGAGHQLFQSLIAVGTGGLWGVGLGNSMQKYFLTEQFTDFIFAIVAEELGFIGAAFVVLCFLLLIMQGWRVALRAPDFYGTLLASGLTLMIMINVVLNLMVVLGLAPTKGLVLPLLSYGGSNMIVTLTAIGILMNVGKYIERHWEEARPGREKKKKNRRRGGLLGLFGRKAAAGS